LPRLETDFEAGFAAPGRCINGEPNSMGTLKMRRCDGVTVPVGAAVLAAVLAFMGAPLVAAQAPMPTDAPGSPAHRPHAHPRPAAAQPLTPAPAPASETSEAHAAEGTTATPETPHWPVNDQAAVAAVTWDSQGLRIDAANSSLQQILKDISTATGAKVEGMSTDERVFGAYGPGQARDVLSQLLQGAGYNVMMIGDQGQGAPREILLSVRRSSDAQAANNKSGANNGDEDAADNEPDEPPVQPQPMPMRPGFGPGGPRGGPQRMQDMRNQQQPPQNNQPQN